MILLTTWFSTLLLFVYCYYGKIATDSFIAMSDCLYESNWHNLPIHLQKYFIIMITNAQRKLYYHGFGILFLNLETFSAVIECSVIWIIEILIFFFVWCVICSYSKPFSLITWFLRRSRHKWNQHLIGIKFHEITWLIGISIFVCDSGRENGILEINEWKNFKRNYII